MPFNQTLFHSEVNTWRAVTGGAYNIRGVYGNVFPTVGTIPMYVQFSGTITATGRMVRGTNTLFATGGRLAVNDFIYAAGVVRRVKAITDNNLLELEYPFPSAVTDQPMRICKANCFRMVQAKSTGSVDATKLQAAKFVQNDVAIFSAPISYDATAGEISFTIND